MSLAIVVLSVIAVSNIIRRNTLATSLENVYEQNFYDVVSNVNDLEVKLSKLTATNSDTIKSRLLIEIWNQCNFTTNSLSALPISHQTVADTSAFLNKLGAFAYINAINLSNGEDITSENTTQFNTLHTSCVTLQKDINDLSEVISGNYNIVNNAKKNNLGDFSSNFSSMQKNSVNYPSLIYDGPFSDSVINKEIKGLPDNILTAEEAKSLLEEKTKDTRITKVVYNGKTEGKFTTYDFNLKLNTGHTAYAQVTEKGGLVLTISNYRAVDTITKTEDECIIIAEDFATKFGFENMKSVWVMQNNNIAYVNLVYTENDVIYYPDLIVVKIAMDTGEMLGWEAMSYAYNHTGRIYSEPEITELQAKSSVSPLLTIDNVRLAVIPKEYLKEVFTYEIACSKDGLSYFVYVNAITGVEEEVLRVVDTNQGSLVQ